MSVNLPTCELCTLRDTDSGDVIVSSAQWRVILVDDANYPGFCRVIWNDHVKEMTDLNDVDKMTLMSVVWQVEAAIREVMQPDKINLASFGNMVPHVHWHVIPRYNDDLHFPHPIWAVAQARQQDQVTLDRRRAVLLPLREAILSRLS